MDLYIFALFVGGAFGAIAGMSYSYVRQKHRERALVFNACHDALTGLANRTLFVDRVAQRMKHIKRRGERPFAIMFLDLDRFKLINDSLGHVLGDQLLCEVARRLENSIRPGDTISRLGGDEFTLLLEEVRSEVDAVHIADRIHTALRLPIRLDGQEVYSSTSIGIALSREDYARPEDIMRDADAAMYRAKALGPGRTEVFDSGMHASSLSTLQTETDLRRAIERHELRVYYQPIISFASGKIAGFEALIRWQHPVRGLVGPMNFVRVAEEAGLIIDLDRWVLRTACAQLADWTSAHPVANALTMNVNLSAKQFARTDLVDVVASILEEAKLGRNRLALEITETAIIENNGHAKEALARLNTLGAMLYLDDFGTGYSSLSYLHRFPIHAVKIDRSFVVNIHENRGQELVQAIITMAHALKLKVTAEGVETVEQAGALDMLGCDFAQGYLFSPPIEAIAAEEIIARDARFH